MATPATLLMPQARPDRAQTARMIVNQLNAWAAQCPEYRETLDDCAEEVAFRVSLPPRAAPGPVKPLKQGVKEIVTALNMWAELYREHSRSLLACAEEIGLLAASHEQADSAERSRDAVLRALETGFSTCPQIARATGLRLRRVQRAVVRLVQLKLVEDVGCAATTHAEGFRTRLYALKYTPHEKLIFQN